MTSKGTSALLTDPEMEWSAPVPFVDLQLANTRVAAAVDACIRKVIDTGTFVLGPAVEQFETEYAAFSGVEHCVGVANGTDAVELALRGAGIGPGDEVIIPANTFVATAEGIRRCGADVVLADCTEDFLLDPADIGQRITGRTRAIVGVDLYGQVADFDAIRAVAPDSVQIFEDAAQSQGATYRGRPAGSFGTAAATSFYPGKNLGAFGDAGAVLTHSAEVAQNIRRLRNHGGILRYEHSVVGTNSRMDSIQAAVLSAKLAVLRDWNRERCEAAERYATLLAEVDGVVVPRVAPGNDHVWHLYVVRVQQRDLVKREMERRGIGCGLHYPLPIHRLAAFSDLDVAGGRLPVAERLAGEILSLPMFPGITGEQQVRVVDSLRMSLQ